MKHNGIVAFLLIFTIIIGLFSSCEGIGDDPPIVTTEQIETEPLLYDPNASPIELTANEESEIINAFIALYESSISVSDYRIRCFGARDGAYAVFVELNGRTPVDFEDWLEDPYDTPMTREYFGSTSFDFWYEIGNPLLIYKDGEFYRLCEAFEKNIVSGAFLNEVNDLYKSANAGFYDRER